MDVPSTGGPGDVKEMLAVYGFAAYHSTACEKKLMLLGAVVSSVDQFPLQQAAFDASMVTLNAQTLGRIKKAVSGLIVLPEATLARLDEAVDKRNYLVHDFFWDHSDDELSAAGREQMICELKELADFFSSTALMIDSITQSVIQALAAAHGIPPGAVDQVMADEMERSVRAARARGGGDA